MGTHPIFESDFDCLTGIMSDMEVPIEVPMEVPMEVAWCWDSLLGEHSRAMLTEHCWAIITFVLTIVLAGLCYRFLGPKQIPLIEKPATTTPKPKVKETKDEEKIPEEPADPSAAKPADDDGRKILDTVKQLLLTRPTAGYKGEIVLHSYKTKAIAGYFMVYFMKVSIGDKVLHARVDIPLPHKGHPNDLHSFDSDVTLESEINFF